MYYVLCTTYLIPQQKSSNEVLKTKYLWITTYKPIVYDTRAGSIIYHGAFRTSGHKCIVTGETNLDEFES